MMRLHDIGDLYQAIRDYCTSRACIRVMQRRGALLLGGFQPLKPSRYAGWILLVKSETGRLWRLGLVADFEHHCLRYLELDRIPWEHWNPTDSTHPLYAGEMADKARLQRIARQREAIHGGPKKPDNPTSAEAGGGSDGRASYTADDLQLDQKRVAED